MLLATFPGVAVPYFRGQLLLPRLEYSARSRCAHFHKGFPFLWEKGPAKQSFTFDKVQCIVSSFTGYAFGVSEPRPTSQRFPAILFLKCRALHVTPQTATMHAELLPAEAGGLVSTSTLWPAPCASAAGSPAPLPRGRSLHQRHAARTATVACGLRAGWTDSAHVFLLFKSFIHSSSFPFHPEKFFFVFSFL